MIKRLQFLMTPVAALMLTTSVHAQNPCATGAPPAEWDTWFNQQVETYQKNHSASKTQVVTYTLPVVVHVVHFGQAIGTFPNIDSNQIKTQLAVLEQDFAGIGAGYQNTPSSFTAVIANPGIKFCRAKIHGLTNAVLTEPGIDRIDAQANTWTDPSTPTLNLVNYMYSTIIPATIWDPTKYLNIWISDKPPTMAANGFATYPSGTTLNGLFNGTLGTSNNDGIWVWTKAFGTIGTLQAPYNKGRTATHELGHWLGLRHIWGDGNCYSDYCNDTPTQKGPHTTCPTSVTANECGINTAPNGPMYMNYMDNTDDICRYMFTHDQNVRMQAALSQCPNRNQLGTHSLCSSTNVPTSASAPYADFELGTDLCIGSPITPYNKSSGFPTPTFLWSSSPAVTFSPGVTFANPAIIINNPGTYTISVVATNSVSSSTKTLLVNATFSCSAFNDCIDSLRMIKSTDTLTAYKAKNDPLFTNCASGNPGFLTGTNCYNDKEFAQFFPPFTYSGTPAAQVNDVLVLFDKKGTKAAVSSTQIFCKVYGGNASTGPGSTTGNFASATLGNIASATSTNSVTYMAKSGNVWPTGMIPYTFSFPQPVIVNASSGFYIAITAPYTSPNDSIRIMSSTIYSKALDSSAWYLTNPTNVWRPYKSFRSANIQLAIMPFMTCSAINGVASNGVMLKEHFKLMPNPADGRFNMVFTLPKEQTVSIKVYNSLGQVVSYDELSHVSNDVFTLDLTAQPNGIYYSEVKAGNETAVHKVIIQH